MSEPTAAPRFLNTGVVAACLILAPVCEFVEQLLSPLDGSSTTADLAAIDTHGGAFVASVLVGLVATVLYVPAYLGLAAICLPRSPRLARTAGCLAVLSMMGFCGVRMMQAVQLQLVRDGFPHGRSATLVDHAGTNAIGATLLVMFLGGTVIGIIALAATTWRSGFPRPAVVLLIVFPFVDLAAPGHPGTLASHAVLLVALSWLAVALVRNERIG